MDIDDLKRTWQSQAARIDRLEAQNDELRRRIAENRIDNKRSKLMRTYTALIVSSITIIPFLLLTMPYLDVSTPVTVALICAMVMLCIFNAVVYNMIRCVDLTAMTMRQALEHVLRLDKMRRTLRWCGIVIVGIVMVFFFVDLWNGSGKDAVIGGVVGGIIGAIIGIRKEREIRETIRHMANELDELDSDES